MVRMQANAFLKQMVRNVVGTLVDVGKGKLDPEGMKGVLEARDRTKAGMTAPPQGLFLVEVEY
jgi:tRNA pseudouridine38-40 synthase